jgi:hypothetical protein
MGNRNLIFYFSISIFLLSMFTNCSKPSIQESSDTTTAVSSSTSLSNLKFYGIYTLVKGGNEIPGFWQGNTWTSLPLPADAQGGIVFSVSKINNTIYVAGSVKKNLSYAPVLWVNDQLQELPVPTTNVITKFALLSIFLHGTDLIISGWYEYKNGSNETVNAGGYFRNGIWVDVNSIDNFEFPVMGGTSFQGSLYLPGVIRSTPQAPGFFINNVQYNLPVPQNTDWINPYTISSIGNDLIILADLKTKVDASNNSDLRCGYWINGVWRYMPQPTVLGYATSDCKANGFLGYPKQLYVIGYVWIQNRWQTGYWLNDQWTSLPELSITQESFADKIFDYQGSPLIVGNSDDDQKISRGVYWYQNKIYKMDSPVTNSAYYSFVSGIAEP